MSSRLALLFGLAAGFSLGAEAAPPQPLADNSPFLPPGVSANGSADPTALDLRGIMWTDQGLRYCIFDPATKSSVWAGLNERGYGFLIKSADPKKEVVTVQAGGRTLFLAMHEATVAALPGGSNGAGGEVFSHEHVLSPSEQAARLAAIAQEVARRRQLRQEPQSH